MTKTEAKILSFVFSVFIIGLFFKYVLNSDSSRYDISSEVSVKAQNFFADSSDFQEKKVESEQEVLDFSTIDKNRIAKKSKVEVATVNINTAGAKELEKLPGIGKLTARKILEFRKKNGNFKSTEDLLKVKGIGEKKLEKLKNFIKLGN